ncbi:hemin ABC transporter, periplasmic hemin-binding HutB domain protein, partial [Vibrio parahaemolyticus V-223/04]
MLLRRIPLS